MPPTPRRCRSRRRPRAAARAGRGRPRRLTVLALVTGMVIAGCAVRDDEADLVRGKQLFTERCGNCHVLARAGTTGKIGPDLDESFDRARRDGIGRKTIAGIARGQIAHPGRNSRMPAGLVEGDAARDVAAYVARVAGVPGEDQGALARAGVAGARDGEQIFRAAGCGACHTLSAAGTTASAGPSLDELARVAATRRAGMSPQEYVREAIVRPDAFVVPGFSPTMPEGYGEQLDDAQLDALVKFLLRAQGG